MSYTPKKNPALNEMRTMLRNSRHPYTNTGYGFMFSVGNKLIDVSESSERDELRILVRKQSLNAQYDRGFRMIIHATTAWELLGKLVRHNVLTPVFVQKVSTFGIQFN